MIKEKLAHIVSGTLTALTVIVNPILPLIGFLVFFTYEATEQKVIGDEMFVEMREFGVGFFAGATALLIVKLLGFEVIMW